MTKEVEKIRAVLFDLGDTLVHFVPISRWQYLEKAAQLLHERISAFGYTVPAYPRYLRRLRWTLLQAYLWDRLRRREVQLLSAFDRCHRRMGIRLTKEQADQLRLNAIDALRSLMTVDEACHAVVSELQRSGMRLGLVSNTLFPGVSIDEFLASEGLLHFFPVRIYSSEVHYRKPHPRIFAAALRELDVPAENTLFVGDRLDNDVAGPARVGMKTALVVHNGVSAPGRVRPDHVVRKLTDLLEILAR